MQYKLVLIQSLEALLGYRTDQVATSTLTRGTALVGKCINILHTHSLGALFWKENKSRLYIFLRQGRFIREYSYIQSPDAIHRYVTVSLLRYFTLLILLCFTTLVLYWFTTSLLCYLFQCFYVYGLLWSHLGNVVAYIVASGSTWGEYR